jgi:hypothetical protein
MVVAVTPNRSGGPPSNRLTQKVVLARVTTGRDIAEHVKDEPDGRLMVRGILASTERLHAVRDVDAVDLTVPMRHCPDAQLRRERQIVRPGSTRLNESAEGGPGRSWNDPGAHSIVAIWPANSTTRGHSPILGPAVAEGLDRQDSRPACPG